MVVARKMTTRLTSHLHHGRRSGPYKLEQRHLVGNKGTRRLKIERTISQSVAPALSHIKNPPEEAIAKATQCATSAQHEESLQTESKHDEDRFASDARAARTRKRSVKKKKHKI